MIHPSEASSRITSLTFTRAAPRPADRTAVSGGAPIDRIAPTMPRFVLHAVLTGSRRVACSFSARNARRSPSCACTRVPPDGPAAAGNGRHSPLDPTPSSRRERAAAARRDPGRIGTARSPRAPRRPARLPPLTDRHAAVRQPAPRRPARRPQPPRLGPPWPPLRDAPAAGHPLGPDGPLSASASPTCRSAKLGAQRRPAAAAA